jgi:hypothetical protein
VSGAIPLSRDYPCKGGGPVLRSVDPAIFALRYFQACMACSFCHDACCSWGVDIDLGNAARLNALPPDFRALVGRPRSEWFTAEAASDPEFPGGAHVRTAVMDGACVFRSRTGRGCVIHAYAVENGLDYHDLKPMVSTLFPVTFEQGVLTAASEAADGSLRCGSEGLTLYEGARDELRHYFGDDLIGELDGLRR